MGEGWVRVFLYLPRVYTCAGSSYFPPALPKEAPAMRAETQTVADEIKQSLALLRRHL